VVMAGRPVQHAGEAQHAPWINTDAHKMGSWMRGVTASVPSCPPDFSPTSTSPRGRRWVTSGASPGSTQRSSGPWT
jgi:hypothetical protein